MNREIVAKELLKISFMLTSDYSRQNRVAGHSHRSVLARELRAFSMALAGYTDGMSGKDSLQNAGLAYWWAMERGAKRRMPKAEKVIAQDPTYAFHYALDIIQGEWKMGEPAIAKDGELSLQYARFVTEKEFKAGEKAIATKPHLVYWYAAEVLKNRFKLGEPTVVKKMVWAYWYWKNILEGAKSSAFTEDVMKKIQEYAKKNNLEFEYEFKDKGKDEKKPTKIMPFPKKKEEVAASVGRRIRSIVGKMV